MRYGQQLRLIILEYDEQYRQQIEEVEISELCDIKKAPETNRIRMKDRAEINAAQPFSAIKNVIIGDIEFEVSGSENRRLNVQDGESVLFLSELLRCGNLVEQPVTLTVNGQYPEKLWFRNEKTGEEHWAQINNVYLSDMWADMEKTFSDPKVLEQITKEQIDESKKEFEEKFSEICPKGMCYPIVEYECEECISLQFYTKKYLESMPVNKNSCMGFIVGAVKLTGILGMKLKAAIIQEPVTVNTASIEAELFQYFKTITPDDIIL